MSINKRISKIIVGGLVLLLAAELVFYKNECVKIRRSETITSKQYMIGSAELYLEGTNSWYKKILYCPLRAAYKGYLKENNISAD